MDITREEALSVLHGWKDDRRIILATLAISIKTSSCIIGRIEYLNAERIRIDDESISEHEVRTGIEIDLLGVTKFSFDDTRLVVGLEGAEQIRQNYDGFLFLSLPDGVTVNLWAARTSDEIRSSEL